MSRLVSTAAAIVAILIILFIRNEALMVGAPAMFSIIPLLMILMILFYIVRVWIRG